uniref:Uncharacterized protein n=1 Tax=Hemiselmis tepida TaxID=464990 RepID=A0A7S0W0D7_9CRYP|mmetsp:Transcript_35302/g.90174  ORF Transcript_35302/g.90174 Transcript_35302/m.90174 type:complete len:121 (+) Transcript_35302:494-856(+)
MPDDKGGAEGGGEAYEWAAPLLGSSHAEARRAYNAGIGAIAALEVLEHGSIAREQHEARLKELCGSGAQPMRTTKFQSRLDESDMQVVLISSSRWGGETLDPLCHVRAEYNSIVSSDTVA